MEGRYMNQLHPDWPTLDPDARYTWDQPDPLSDLISALDASGGSVGVGDIAAISHYDITSEDGKWAPGGSVATELKMSIVGTLHDGRWFALEGWNDYTGWGCQDGADLYVGDSLDDVVRNGLTEESRNALGLALA